MTPQISISKTKIIVPSRRPELLSRARLLENIGANLDRKLILLSAPAGYGKTSFLIDLANNTRLPVCWLSLDPLDRDPQRFIAYLIAALAERFSGLNAPLQPLLNDLKSIETDAEPLLVALTNELYEQVEEDFLLIIDDYHLVDDLPVISSQLNRFLQLADDNCHLILSSRGLPSLADITLMVAREQVEGLSQTDLAFQPREIQALFNQNHQQHISEQTALQLAEQTGGWITGLILTELSGTARVGIDTYSYLSRQVLDQQPADLREFLLRTSIPDEFNAELCDAILTPFQPGPQNWSALMSLILEKNLFVLPVGVDGRWLRYHPLFREFLQARLYEERPSEVRDILEQLTHFHEASGEWEKAYFTCQQLNDPEMLANVVERAGTPMLQHAFTTLENWVNGLPPSLIRLRTGLISLRGVIAIIKGNYPDAFEQLSAAEKAYRKEKNVAGLALVLTRRALAYRQMGDYQASLKDAEEALKLTEPDITLQPLYAEALRIKGANLYRLGHSRQAIDYLEHSLSLFTALKETGSIPILLVETGAVYSAIGDIEAAKTSFQKALLIWQTEKNITAQADVLNNLAVLYHQNGEYEVAVEMFENGLSLARKSRYTRAEALILIGLGDLYAEVGEFESADQAYEKALPISKQWAGSFIEIYLILARANLATLQNDATRGKVILQGARKKLQSTSSLYEQGLQALIEGRIFMLDSQAVKAVTAFRLCKEKFTQDGRIIESLWSCVWLTAALSESGKVELARAELRELLNLHGRPTHATLVALQQAATWLRPMLKDPQVGRSLGGLMEKADRLEAKLPAVRRSLRRLAQSIQMPAASLSIRAFGRAEVQVDGHTVSSSEWSAQSVRDLFFYLIYKGGAVTKEQIAASLWPEVYDLQILKQRFKTYLFRLRRATRRDVVIFDDEYYRFNYALDYEYDVETFETYLARSRTARGVDERIEHIQKAVDLIQGPYLAEVDMPWALGERERLEQAYLVALENLAQLYLDTDQFQQSVVTLQRALKSDPYIERVHQLLMRAHAALGDRSAIHRQYQVCKTSLLELGFSPSHETEALYRGLTR